MLAKTFSGFINLIGVKRKRCGSCNGCVATDCGDVITVETKRSLEVLVKRNSVA